MEALSYGVSTTEYFDMDAYDLAQAIEAGKRREARAADMLVWAAATVANPKQKKIKLTDMYPIQRKPSKNKISKKDKARVEEIHRRRDEARQKQKSK